MRVRKARLEDLDAVKTIADANKTELGFVLRPSLTHSILRQEVFVAENELNIIGFVEFHHRKDNQTTLYHIAVAIEARRRKIGGTLLDALCEEAKSLNKSHIQLKCPQELTANIFYERYGFSLVGIEHGKKRDLNIWRYCLG